MNKRKCEKSLLKMKQTNNMQIKYLYNTKGITLIALVISIIVMLILAGVSLNATIGENGIMTQAKNATYVQCCAILEEYLNNYYVEHYEQMNSNENKAEALVGMVPNWFYHPNMNYVVDSDGIAHYFIIPENLPDEIGARLKVGKCENKEYIDYISCNDVYGVTKDLKVYYCSKGKDTILGISENQLEQDSPTRVIFQANSNWAKLISGNSDTEIQVKDIKSITTVKIDETNGITELSEIYNIIGLKEIEFKNIEINITGIENLGKLESISFNNCSIKNESAIAKCSNLTNISLINETQEVVNKILDSMKIRDFSKLNCLEIYADSTEYKNMVTNINQLSEFTEITKKSLKRLNIQNEGIDTLSFLNGYDNLSELDITSNTNITCLKGLTSQKLVNLYANYCNLGANETDECNEENALYPIKDCADLGNVYLRGNKNLKHINYLKKSKYYTLYLIGNSNMLGNEVAEIRETYLNSTLKNIDSKYQEIINGTEIINYANKNLTDDSVELENIKENNIIISLKLDGNTNITNDKLNEILENCTNLKYLSLRNLENITSIDFLKKLSNLKVLDLYGCSNLNDLQLLEELKNTNKQNLTTLRIDNDKIDLTKIQNVINGLDKENAIGKYDLDCNWSGYHGFIAPYSVWKNLEKCSELTSIKGAYVMDRNAFGSGNSAVDLTNCNKLKIISLSYIAVNLKVPDSVTYINMSIDSIKSNIQFSNNSNLNEIHLQYAEDQWTNERFSNWCKNLQVCQNLRKIEISERNKFKSSISKLENIELLKNCSALRILDIHDLKNLLDITGIGELSQVTELSLYNCTQLVDISDFTTEYEENTLKKGLINLTKLNLSNNSIDNIECIKDYTNLQELNLSKNRISNIYSLNTLKKLSKLDLSNNCIYDTEYYIDDSGNNKVFNSTEILLNLYNENLRYIYLDNNYIVDYSKISKLNWKEKTGF